MNNTGYLSFGNDEAKQNLLSLSEVEKKEFEVDLAQLLKKTNEEMVKANFFEGHHFANQRLGNRNFRVELWVDLSPEKEPLIVLQQFKELAIDDYLDSINADKNLKNEGFVRLLP
jgi:hypothetical protein